AEQKKRRPAGETRQTDDAAERAAHADVYRPAGVAGGMKPGAAVEGRAGRGCASVLLTKRGSEYIHARAGRGAVPHLRRREVRHAAERSGVPVDVTASVLEVGATLARV